MMHFKDITWDNLSDLLHLTITKEQEKYLPSISAFLAQSYVNLKAKYEDYSMAVYDEDDLIGYVKVVYVPKEVKPYLLPMDSYMIDALVIREEKQGQGYGLELLKRLFVFMDEEVEHKGLTITLTCHKENKDAIRLFEANGFVKLSTYGGKKNLDLYQKQR